MGKSECIGIVISILFPILWTIILYLLKPNLKIMNTEISESEPSIRIRVMNNSWCFEAINLNMEVCIVTKKIKKYTYHLEIDKHDFLILQKKEKRIFQSFDLAQSAKRYYNGNFGAFIEEIIKNPENIIRVRVYAANEYSGFGKAKGKEFRYNVNTKLFEIV